MNQTVVQCPTCGTKATVLEDRVPALLERWRQEHERTQQNLEETA